MSAIDPTRAQCAHFITLLVALCAIGSPAAARAQHVPSPTHGMDRLPVPARQNAADLGAIASSYAAAVAAGPDQAKPAPQVLIMVSFSMPWTSLASLAEQARRAGALLVLNGLKDGSLTATAQAVHQIFGEQGAPLQIDPRLFTRYAVSTVPTFILRSANGNEPACVTGSCPVGGYAKASGDVSLDYALEQITRTQPKWRASAKAILQRMGK